MSVGDEILANDGLVRLEVLGSNENEIRCRVVQGGFVGDHKGLNLPGVDISAPALTPKDVDDLHLLNWKLDAEIAAGHHQPVEGGNDVVRRCDRLGHLQFGEHSASYSTRESISSRCRSFAARRDVESVRAVMDDVGQHVPVPGAEAGIQGAREHTKPVIVATQMLESMVTAPTPTRAEVSDVANAVLDGADALMLSGETAVGRWPTEAVRMMGQVGAAAERRLYDDIPPLQLRPTGRERAIAQAAVAIGSTTNAAALVAFTQTGTTARRLAAHRPPLSLVALTPHSAVQNQLTVSSGVEPFVAPTVATTDEMIGAVNAAIRDLHRA